MNRPRFDARRTDPRRLPAATARTGAATLANTLAAAALAALLAGCASPEPRYYTLAQASGTGAAAAPQATPQGKPVWIEVAPVHVPERLNRAELVVGEDGSADGDSRLRRLELARWSAPLPDELRDALSQRLQAALDAQDTYRQGLSGVEPVYRITADVVRLDAAPGGRAGALINWTVRRLPDGKLASGQSRADLPAGSGVDGVVAAYRQILAGAADDIAGGVRALRP